MFYETYVIMALESATMLGFVFPQSDMIELDNEQMSSKSCTEA